MPCSAAERYGHNYDENPVLQVDSTQVDLTVPGTYDVIYTATDAVGNQTVLKTTITVKEKSYSYVDESVIYAKADELLENIVEYGMTAKEQVEAIYDWVKSHCRYNGYSDKTDTLQAAYQMMTKRSGDCFNYFAIFSVFFDRLGIPYIRVQRSANSARTTTHYWILASVDGGKSYYHVDACPAAGFSARICLVTDATLQSYNRYSPGYYTVDADVYPATPEEEVQ